MSNALVPICESGCGMNIARNQISTDPRRGGEEGRRGGGRRIGRLKRFNVCADQRPQEAGASLIECPCRNKTPNGRGCKQVNRRPRWPAYGNVPECV